MISIVIPTYREHHPEGYDERLRTLLRSCLEQMDCEIIVVPNSPLDACERIARELNASQISVKISVTKPSGIGVNRARNQGLMHARGELVLFLDDDCLLPDRLFLSRLESLARAAPEFSAFGGGYLDCAGAGWSAREYHQMTRLWLECGFESLVPDALGLYPCRDLLGGVVAYRREIFRQGFRFDESIRSGADETELHRRLVRHGKKLAYHPSLSVYHRAANRWRAHFRRSWRQGWNAGERSLTGTGPQLRLSQRLLMKPAHAPYLLAHFLVLRSGRAMSETGTAIRRLLPSHTAHEW